MQFKNHGFAGGMSSTFCPQGTYPGPQCYFEKNSHVESFELHGFSDASEQAYADESFELHGFSDASEQAYAAVVYLRMACIDGDVQVALITSKTKVAPIKN